MDGLFFVMGNNGFGSGGGTARAGSPTIIPSVLSQLCGHLEKKNLRAFPDDVNDFIICFYIDENLAILTFRMLSL